MSHSHEYITVVCFYIRISFTIWCVYLFVSKKKKKGYTFKKIYLAYMGRYNFLNFTLFFFMYDTITIHFFFGFNR